MSGALLCREADTLCQRIRYTAAVPCDTLCLQQALVACQRLRRQRHADQRSHVRLLQVTDCEQAASRRIQTRVPTKASRPAGRAESKLTAQIQISERILLEVKQFMENLRCDATLQALKVKQLTNLQEKIKSRLSPSLVAMYSANYEADKLMAASDFNGLMQLLSTDEGHAFNAAIIQSAAVRLSFQEKLTARLCAELMRQDGFSTG